MKSWTCGALQEFMPFTVLQVKQKYISEFLEYKYRLRVQSRD